MGIYKRCDGRRRRNPDELCVVARSVSVYVNVNVGVTVVVIVAAIIR
jgi:hypothetical protein